MTPSYTLTEEDFDGGLTVFDPSTGITRISGRNIHTGEITVAYLNVPLCSGCDKPFDDGWCPRCEASERADEQNTRALKFLVDQQKRDAA